MRRIVKERRMNYGRTWLEKHEKDPYVKRAKEQGYPSRAAFKLLEIHQRYNLFKTGIGVIDLGAAPGGWSKVIKNLVGSEGFVIALDLLPLRTTTGIEFIQGDFNEPAIFNKLKKVITKKIIKKKVDLIVSDMAPNISGVKNVDQLKSLHLVELAWNCAQKLLVKDGIFLVKVFQSPFVNHLLINLKNYFNQVKCIKPDASRSRSSEIYILAREFLGYNQQV